MFRGQVLVVEDDLLLGRHVSALLARAGFYTEHVIDGQAAVDAIDKAPRSAPFNCVVLDIHLPGAYSGLDVLAILRQNGTRIPVLLLTDLNSESDVVAGFGAGADDYMGKPLRGRELVARVIRLVQASGPDDAPAVLGDAVIDLDALVVSGPQGRRELTATEVRLLRSLLASPRRVVPLPELLVAGWSSSSRRNLRSLYEHVRRLRASFDELNTGVSITSVRGHGYRLEAAARRGG